MTGWLKPAVVAVSLCLIAGPAAGSVCRPGDKGDKEPGNPPPGRGELDCSGAVEIGLGDCLLGSNVGAPNNVSLYGCSSWDESGGEVVFHLYLAPPTLWEATLTPIDCDLDLVALDQCEEDLGCLALGDDRVYTPVPVEGDFFLVVDGYGGAECDFLICVNEMAPQPAACEAVLPRSCEDGLLLGDTCDTDNYVDGLPCATYAHGGYEHWFAVTLDPGGHFSAEIVFPDGDCVLLVMGNCEPEYDCLAYVDDTLAGGSEFIAYQNDTGAQQVVFLVIDAWTDSQLCGAYEGTFTCVGGLVDGEAFTWGNVKTLYR